MKRVLNLLILLGIISMGRYNFSANVSEEATAKPPAVNKGPVYNPLRAKPFVKFTAKV